MTTAPATLWPRAPHRTGQDALRAILAAPHGQTSRALWDLLHRAFPGARGTLSRPGGPLEATMHPRLNVVATERERMRRLRPVIATEFLEDLHRALIHSPGTLAALADGEAHPVRAHERDALAKTVSRRLLVLGCDPNEVAVRRLTDATVEALRDALAALPD